MGLKPVSKKDREIAVEEARKEGIETIINSGKPPEKSVFSNNWRVIAGTVAAAGVLAAVAMTVAASKKKNGHKE